MAECKRTLKWDTIPRAKTLMHSNGNRSVVDMGDDARGRAHGYVNMGDNSDNPPARVKSYFYVHTGDNSRGRAQT